MYIVWLHSVNSSTPARVGTCDVIDHTKPKPRKARKILESLHDQENCLQHAPLATPLSGADDVTCNALHADSIKISSAPVSADASGENTTMMTTKDGGGDRKKRKAESSARGGKKTKANTDPTSSAATAAVKGASKKKGKPVPLLKGQKKLTTFFRVWSANFFA